jgi:DNA-binding response OmpR family regulator
MERVLIVDDDPDIQRLVSYNLSQAGFQVTTALCAGWPLTASKNIHPI